MVSTLDFCTHCGKGLWISCAIVQIVGWSQLALRRGRLETVAQTPTHCGGGFASDVGRCLSRAHYNQKPPKGLLGVVEANQVDEDYKVGNVLFWGISFWP